MVPPLFSTHFSCLYRITKATPRTSQSMVMATHIMPFSRLVYAQSFATPLAKKMGLAALTLKAARSSIIIPELNAADVNYFIEYLTKEGEA